MQKVDRRQPTVTEQGVLAAVVAGLVQIGTTATSLGTKDYLLSPLADLLTGLLH